VTRPWPSAGEKPLHWVGSSHKDLLGFPEGVVGNIGYALGVLQFGARPPSAKPKSPSGIRTARPDLRLIEARLRLAREDYEVRYGGKEEEGRGR
jgi:phage-related protein